MEPEKKKVWERICCGVFKFMISPRKTKEHYGVLLRETSHFRTCFHCANLHNLGAVSPDKNAL
jgi:hypothetical protein